jgi:hypothetical protein
MIYYVRPSRSFLPGASKQASLSLFLTYFEAMEDDMEIDPFFLARILFR